MHLNFESIHFKSRIHWITNFIRSIHDNILLSTPPFYFYTPSWISWGQHDAHLHNKFYVKICDEKPHKSWPWFLLWAYIYIIYKFLDNVWENTNCVALLFRASRKTFPFSNAPGRLNAPQCRYVIVPHTFKEGKLIISAFTSA